MCYAHVCSLQRNGLPVLTASAGDVVGLGYVLWERVRLSSSQGQESVGIRRLPPSIGGMVLGAVMGAEEEVPYVVRQTITSNPSAPSQAQSRSSSTAPWSEPPIPLPLRVSPTPTFPTHSLSPVTCLDVDLRMWVASNTTRFTSKNEYTKCSSRYAGGLACDWQPTFRVGYRAVAFVHGQSFGVVVQEILQVTRPKQTCADPYDPRCVQATEQAMAAVAGGKIPPRLLNGDVARVRLIPQRLVHLDTFPSPADAADGVLMKPGVWHRLSRLILCDSNAIVAVGPCAIGLESQWPSRRSHLS